MAIIHDRKKIFRRALKRLCKKDLQGRLSIPTRSLCQWLHSFSVLATSEMT